MARWIETSWVKWSFEETYESTSSDTNSWSKGIWKLKGDSIEKLIRIL